MERVDTRRTNEIAPQDGHLGGAAKLRIGEEQGEIEAAAAYASGRGLVPDDALVCEAIDEPPSDMTIIDSIDNSLNIFAMRKK